MIAQPLRRAFDRFKSGPYTVTRRTAAGYGSNGMKVAGVATTLSVYAIVQPIAGRELEALPEAQRATEVRSFITEVELKTREPGYAPDTIELDGQTWTVIRVGRWALDGGAHWESHVALVPRAS